MTKKQVAITAFISFVVGVTIGMVFAGKNGKIVVNGDNNTIKTGYKSYCGNDNGCNNSSKVRKSNK